MALKTSCRILLVLLCCHTTLALAQQRDSSRVRSLLGCWATNVGTFIAISKYGVDSGQTNVPPRVRFDSVPGRSITNRPLGRLLQAIPGLSGTRYRDGYWVIGEHGDIGLDWSNGFTGLGMSLRQTGDTLRGYAKVWTDYGGDQRAPITLHRIACR